MGITTITRGWTEAGATTPATFTKRTMNTGEAAEYCDLGKSTLDKLRLSGGGPEYLKVFRRVVYRVEDLDAWLAGHRRRSTTEAE